jgi:DMSO/TMAO reductase YedYZ molybdopterin-dependent catalytic subunit
MAATQTRRHVPAIALALLLASTAVAQSDASVSVTGNVQQALVLKGSDLAKMPRATLSTTNSGVVTTYEGVLLSEILKKAALSPGEENAGYVVASASDGYRALFSLAELDPTVTDSQVLLADRSNGKPLTGRDGTFRLVAPKDIRGVRSVRQLVKLEVVLLSPR